MATSFIPKRLATFSCFYKLWKMLSSKLSYFCQVYEKSSFIFLLSNIYIPLVLNTVPYSTYIVLNKHVHYQMNKSTLVLWNSFLKFFSSMLWCLRIKSVFDISENQGDSDISYKVYPKVICPEISNKAIGNLQLLSCMFFSPKIFCILYIQMQDCICKGLHQKNLCAWISSYLQIHVSRLFFEVIMQFKRNREMPWQKAVFYIWLK